MLFSTPEYIFWFLPIALAGYFLLRRVFTASAANLWLVAASLYFYAFWKLDYLPVLLLSMVVNYVIGSLIAIDTRGRRIVTSERLRRWLTAGGIVFNVLLLAYFKYTFFLVATLGEVAGTGWSIDPILLPLGISFFTFQKIAFLVDSHRGKYVRHVNVFRDMVNYALFVCFFPQLIAGPIVHHSEMMPQFADPANSVPKAHNLAAGAFLFTIGLAKKLCIADVIGRHADAGYAAAGALDIIEAWATTLAYTAQLYFDFSGYSDMALGAALMFNIRIPYNFNSPYKARNLQDFWQRWHMTLSRWIRDYLYIPLGGARRGRVRTYVNLLLAFFISGIWHGAGWTFMLWGLMHGAGVAVVRWLGERGVRLPALVATAITLVYVHLAWVLFRAPDLHVAAEMYRRMAGIGAGALHVHDPRNLGHWFVLPGGPATIGWEVWPLIAIAAAVALLLPNSNQIVFDAHGAPRVFRVRTAVLFGVLVSMCVVASATTVSSPFLYFNF